MICTSPAWKKKSLSDPLEYLPCAPVREFARGSKIYDQEHKPESIFLILRGMVEISRVPECGKRVVIDILKTDEFFGESAVLGLANQPEAAWALVATQVMEWTMLNVETLSMKSPRLALALMQLFISRSADFVSRIESFSNDNIERRLARSLIRLSGRLGRRVEPNVFAMAAITHEIISQYVGTSREIVTQHMNQFRERKCLSYSRKTITVNCDALENWLRTPKAARRKIST